MLKEIYYLNVLYYSLGYYSFLQNSNLHTYKKKYFSIQKNVIPH